MKRLNLCCSWLASVALILRTSGLDGCGSNKGASVNAAQTQQQDQQSQPAAQNAQMPAVDLTADALDELHAPVALYPDPVLAVMLTSRKCPNLKKNPRVAWVIGCTTEVTVQYEGVAEELSGEELAKYKKTYFAAFPDGPARESWPDITYFVVRPKWVRYCDYNPGTRRIEEREL